MGAQGQTTINFGAFPGAAEAEVAITGQASITTAALVEAWVTPVTTSDHSVAEHYFDPPRVMAGEITNGVGFIIRGFSPDINLRYGLFTVNWVWNQ